MPDTTAPRFACDAMLGSLARWLRAAGYDAFWQEGIDDWDLIRLAQALGRAGPSKSAQDLFDFLQKMASLSPRSQSIRSWVQYELLRSGAVPISEATVAAMDPQHTAGAALAWEALGRHMGTTGDAPATVANCSPAIRSKPLALAGIALGLLDH